MSHGFHINIVKLGPMSEWHQISHENEAPRTAPAFASSELATVGSISAPRGSFSARDSRSVQSLHVVLAAIASITSIAFLVFLCARVYERRVVHGLRRRRLANSEDEGASVQGCVAGDDEEKQPHENLPPTNLSAGKDSNTSVKTPSLTRPTGIDDGGVGGNPQQHDQQQQHLYGAAALPLGLPEDRPSRSQDQVGSSPFPVRSSLPSTTQLTPAGFAASTGLHSPRPRRHTPGDAASGTSKEDALTVHQLQLELWLLQVELQKERRKHQDLQLHLQQQFDEDELLHLQQEQHSNWLQTQWQRLRWQQQQHHLQEQRGQQHSMQRHEQQQPQAPMPPLPQHVSPSPLPVGSSLSARQSPTQAELNAARGLLELFSEHAGENVASQPPRQRASKNGSRLGRQKRRKHRQLQPALTRVSQKPRRMRRNPLLVRQQQGQLQHQQRYQHKLGQPLPWQQQLQQQSLFQQQDRESLMQRPVQHDWMQQVEQAQLLHEQGQQQVVRDKEQQKAMQQEGQQAGPLEESEKQQRKAKRRQEEHGEPDLGGGKQQKLLQPTGPLSEPFLDDGWIAVDTPELVEPQPSTSQQALQASAGAAAARPLMYEHSVMEVVPGQPLVPLPKAPAASTTGASKDETAAAVTTGATAGRAATALELHAAGPSAAASTAIEDSGVEMRNRKVLLPGGNTEGVATELETARTGFAPTAHALRAVVLERVGMLDSSLAPPPGHPFVRLPRLAVRAIPPTLFVDLRPARSQRSTRYIVPLLQEAHDLLARNILSLPQLRSLVRIASNLVEHAMVHQRQDLSKHPTSRAVERLGLRFLLLDIVVCTFIVLGHTPDPGLWQAFTDAISHFAPPMAVRGSKESRYTFFSLLSYELGKAIEVLKTGKRPSDRKLLMIKRMLFCSVESPVRFKSPEFNRWREDDRSHNDED